MIRNLEQMITIIQTIDDKVQIDQQLKDYIQRIFENKCRLQKPYIFIESKTSKIQVQRAANQGIYIQFENILSEKENNKYLKYYIYDSNDIKFKQQFDSDLKDVLKQSFIKKQINLKNNDFGLYNIKDIFEVLILDINDNKQKQIIQDNLVYFQRLQNKDQLIFSDYQLAFEFLITYQDLIGSFKKKILNFICNSLFKHIEFCQQENIDIQQYDTQILYQIIKKKQKITQILKYTIDTFKDNNFQTYTKLMNLLQQNIDSNLQQYKAIKLIYSLLILNQDGDNILINQVNEILLSVFDQKQQSKLNYKNNSNFNTLLQQILEKNLQKNGLYQQQHFFQLLEYYVSNNDYEKIKLLIQIQIDNLIQIQININQKLEILNIQNTQNLIDLFKKVQSIKKLVQNWKSISQVMQQYKLEDMKNQYVQLVSKQKQIYQNWLKKFQQNIEDFSNDIKNQNKFKLDFTKEKITIEFDYFLFQHLKIYRQLQELFVKDNKLNQLKLEDDILQKCNKYKNNLQNFYSIKKIIDFYNDVQQNYDKNLLLVAVDEILHLENLLKQFNDQNIKQTILDGQKIQHDIKKNYDFGLKIQKSIFQVLKQAIEQNQYNLDFIYECQKILESSTQKQNKYHKSLIVYFWHQVIKVTVVILQRQLQKHNMYFSNQNKILFQLFYNEKQKDYILFPSEQTIKRSFYQKLNEIQTKIINASDFLNKKYTKKIILKLIDSSLDKGYIWIENFFYDLKYNFLNFVNLQFTDCQVEIQNKEQTIKQLQNIDFQLNVVQNWPSQIVYKQYFYVNITKLKNKIIQDRIIIKQNFFKTINKITEDSIKQLYSILGNYQQQVNSQKNDITNLRKMHFLYKEINKQKKQYAQDFYLINHVANDQQQGCDFSFSQKQCINFLNEWSQIEQQLLSFTKNAQQNEKQIQEKMQQAHQEILESIEQLEEQYIEFQDIKDQIFDYQNFVELINKAKKLDQYYQNFDKLKQQYENFQLDLNFFGIQFEIKINEDRVNNLYKNYEKQKDNVFKIVINFVQQLENLKQVQWLQLCQNNFSELNKILQNLQQQINLLQTDDVYLTKIKLILSDFSKYTKELYMIQGQQYELNDWSNILLMLNLNDIDIQQIQFVHILEQQLIFQSQIQKISNFNKKLAEEVNVRNSIEQLMNWIQTKSLDFYIYSFQKNQEIQIIGSLDVLFQELDDNYFQVKMLNVSRFFEKYQDSIEVLNQNYQYLWKFLDRLQIVQKKFLNLFPVVTQNNLQEVKQDFTFLDKEFRNLLSFLNQEKFLINFLTKKDKLKTIDDLLISIEKIQIFLQNYLEKNRQIFPRLYFLKEEDILELMSNDMQNSLQIHIKKIFQSVHQLKLDEKKDIEQIMSEDVLGFPESIQLQQKVKTNTELTCWLKDLQNQIKIELKNKFQNFNLDELQNTQIYDIFIKYQNYPNQIQILILEYIFTFLMNKQIKKTNFDSIKSTFNQLLQQISKIEKNTNKLQIQQINQIVMIIIQKLRIIDQFINDSPDWQYFKLLKYQIENNELTINSCDLTAIYQWEYQGNKENIVFTPLTEKCYINFFQCIKQFLGCNLVGPAGTGKTETIKALGNTLGVQVLVFNCDENLDYDSLQRIFKGLIMCGSIGCFDEFNRLSIQKLSTLSQLIQSFYNGLRQQKYEIQLFKDVIKIDKNCKIFTTMNPSSKEYGGRSQLPQNIKELFRIVNMVKPDKAIIIDILLVSFRFTESKILSQKLVQFLQISQDKFSQQNYYDWSLRKIKIILQTSGQILHQQQNQQQFETQQQALIQAINLNFLSSLDSTDLKVYNDTINEVFQIKNNESCVDQNFLQYKLQQLVNLIDKKMGIIIFGDSGKQKSRLIELYKQTQQNHKCYYINPKANDIENFIGKVDQNTGLFKDGILTQISRKIINTQDQNNFYLIILDTEIDPEWIEGLNSVFDDNKILTLPSGERIQYQNNIRFLFECRKIKYASPATISRMGLLNMNQEQSQFKIQYVLQESNIQVYQKFLMKLQKSLKIQSFDVELNILKYIQKDKNMSLIDFIIQSCFLVDKQKRQKILNDFKLQLQNQNLGTKLSQDLYLSVKFLMLQIEHKKSCIIKHQNSQFIRQLLQDSKEKLIQSIKISMDDIYCTYHIKSNYFIKKFKQNFIFVEKGNYKYVTTQKDEHFLYFIYDFESICQDKYQDIQLYEFLYQLITRRIFYDENSQKYQVSEKINFCFVYNGNIQSTDIILQNYQKLSNTCLVLNMEVNERTRIEGNQAIKECIDNTNLNNHSFIDKQSLQQIIQKIEQQIGDFINLEKQQIQKVIKQSLKFQYQDESQFQDILTNLFNIKVKQKTKIQTTQKQFYNNIIILEKSIQKVSSEDYGKQIQQYIEDFKMSEYNISFQINNVYKNLFQALDVSVNLMNINNIFLLGDVSQGKKSLLNIFKMKIGMELTSFPNNSTQKQKTFVRFFRNIVEDIFQKNKKYIVIFEEHHFINMNVFDYLIRFMLNYEIKGFCDEDIQFLIKKSDCFDNLKQKTFKEVYHQQLRQNLIIVIMINQNVIKYNDLIKKYPNLNNIVVTLDTTDCNGYLKQDIIQQFFHENDKLDINNINKIQQTLLKIPQMTLHDIRQFFVNTSKIIKLKNQTLSNEIKRLQQGQQKLQTAREQVESINNEIQQDKIFIMEQEQNSEKLLKEIKEIFNDTKIKREQMKSMKDELHKEEQKIQLQKKQVEMELQETLPFIEQAKSEVSQISKKQIDEIRKLQQPPQKIVPVLSCLLMLMGHSKTDWNQIKIVLSVKTIIEQILNFDPKSITLASYNHALETIQKNPDSFEKQSIYRASRAAGPISEYIKALLRLKETFIKIQPLENNLQNLQKQLDRSKSTLEQLEEEVQNVDLQIEQIKDSYVKKSGQVQILKQRNEKNNEQLNKANNLFQCLQKENHRWIKKCNLLQEQQKQIQKRSMLASLYIILEQSNKNISSKFYKTFKDKLNIDSFDFLQFVATDEQIQKHLSFNSQFDDSTISKLITISQISTINILNDEIGLMYQYFDQFLDKEYILIDIQDLKLLQKIETAIKFAKSIILKKTQSCLPLELTNILKQKIVLGLDQINKIYFNNKTFDIQDDFKLIIFQDDHNQDLYHQKYLYKVENLLNFDSMYQLFQDEILNQKENNLLIQKRSIQQQNIQKQEELFNNEKQVLQILQTQNDLLEDDTLLQKLNYIKNQTKEIEEFLNKQKEQELYIQQQQSQYTSISKYSAVAYQILKNSQKLNNFYNFNVEEFIQIIRETIKQVDDFEGFSFVEIYEKILIKTILKYYSKNFEKKDFNIIIFQLLILVDKNTQYKQYLKIFNVSEIFDQTINYPCIKSEQKESQNIFAKFLQEIPSAKNLLYINNEQIFNQWLSKSIDTQSEQNFKNIDDLFMIMLFKKQYFNDYLQAFVKNKVGYDMSQKNIQNINFQDLIQTKKPIIILTSQNKDPSLQIQKLMQQQFGSKTIQLISCGETKINNLIDDLKNPVEITIIKNLQYSPQICQNLNQLIDSVREDQNIIFITQDTQFINYQILKNSIKIVFEDSDSLLQEIENTYSIITNNDLNLLSNNQQYFIFKLSVLHSLICQMDQQAPKTFSKQYQISISDYCQALDHLMSMQIELYKQQTCVFMQLLKECFYGSKIDQPEDINKFCQVMMDICQYQPFEELDSLQNTLQSHLKVVRKNKKALNELSKKYLITDTQKNILLAENFQQQIVKIIESNFQES